MRIVALRELAGEDLVLLGRASERRASTMTGVAELHGKKLLTYRTGPTETHGGKPPSRCAIIVTGELH